jgi:DNA-binding CsgD family transcriptional regulator
VLAIGLHRAYKHAAFDAADAAAVQTLVPHIRRVVQARHQIRHAAERNVLITAALDTLACSVLVLNADCRLVHANQAAQEFLKSGDGLVWTAGRIVPQEARMTAIFSQAVRSAATASASRGGAMRLRRPEQPPLRALIVPLNRAIGFALVLINPDRPLGLPAILAQMYNLTEAEAGLAMLLQEGHSPREAAALRGVQLSTVRTQIQSMLSKMEARSLSDLLRALSGFPSTI